MDKITKELRVSGVYCIENMINHKTYIGSSKNIYQRLLKHFALLRHNKHENAYLQNAWNKYGESNFRWFILLYCSNEELTKQEQYCIDLFNSEYNITKIVERNMLSKESRIKQGNTRRKLHAEGKLAWNFNPITLYVYDLDGNLIMENPLGIKDTAAKLGVSESSICRILNGTYQQCKGYRFSRSKETLPPIKIHRETQRSKYTNYKHCRLVEKSIKL